MVFTRPMQDCSHFGNDTTILSDRVTKIYGHGKPNDDIFPKISKPLRELLSSKNAWSWEVTQENSFSKLKAEISSPRVLALYDPSAKTKISADASAYGLGGVLLQKQQDQWRPIAFSSRSLSETELRYAQIEKEALALTWALEKLSEYTLGKVIQLETDHKPVVPLLGQKSLDLLRFRLRLMRFESLCTLQILCLEHH